MDKDPKKIDDIIDENLDKFFHVDENEIDDLIKQAETEVKNQEEQKPKEKKKKKKKAEKEEEEDDDD